MTSKDGLIKQTIWWPLLLFSKYVRGHTIAINVKSPEYTGRTNPSWIRGTIETPYLDACAVAGEDGWLNLAVTNVSEEKDFEVDLSGLKADKVEVHTVTGEHVQVTNTAEDQQVGIQESEWDGKGAYVFPKYSFTLLRWKVT
jgi:alpha-N-arabinofuranosidase